MDPQRNSLRTTGEVASYKYRSLEKPSLYVHRQNYIQIKSMDSEVSLLLICDTSYEPCEFQQIR